MTKRNFIISVLMMLFVVASTSFAADKYQWKFVDTQNDCQIYTSVVPGKDYIAAKTTCVIPAKKEVLGVVLRDIANYPEWMEDCKETKMLKVVDDQNDVFIFWFRQHIPLFTDRDMVLKSKVILDPPKGQDLIYADSTNEMTYDSGKGYIRMPSFNSVWILEWVDREHTRVTFMIDPDLSKGLPLVVANATIKKTPYKSLKRLMKIVKQPKYVEAAKTSKYNKAVEDAIKAGYLK
ncbi:MAG: START domain-containing protein [Deltaproteobacteria bacterium]|nr:START domain-containing protein [Deltaproteobacteria bacterium]